MGAQRGWSDQRWWTVAVGCSDAGQHRRLHLRPVPGARAGRAACVDQDGVKRLLGDFAATMSPEVLELYVFIQYNFSYEWLRPTTQEIVDAYLATYGPDVMADDEPDDKSDDDEGDADDAAAADAPAAVGAPHA